MTTSQARDELMDYVCKKEMAVYTQIFHTEGETAHLERYAAHLQPSKSGTRCAMKGAIAGANTNTQHMHKANQACSVFGRN